MAVNTEIVRTGSESSLSVIRKFSRRVQGTGIIMNMRGRRYFSRATSKTVNKKHALKRIIRRNEIKKLIKEGKMTPTVRGRGQHRHSHSSPTTTTQAPTAPVAAATPRVQE